MTYKHAISRRPAATAVNGLTTVDLGVPNFDLLLTQWKEYVSTLQKLGVDVSVLDPLEAFPDAYFVEDVAIVTPEIAVVTRPGALTRRQETEHIQDPLASHRQLNFIEAPGTLDGGDVLVINQHCVIGLSERTNQQGADQLCGILSGYGYKCDVVSVPEALHFKSSVNFLDEATLLTTQTCCQLDCLDEYRKLVVPEGEEYAANVVWINDHILMPKGFEGTRILLEHNGYNVIEMPVSEISKLDGGLTCLSLRIS